MYCMRCNFSKSILQITSLICSRHRRRTFLRFYDLEALLTCLLLVMSDVRRELETAGARRVHVRGETIVASAQRGHGNRQAGTHACAGG